MWTVEITNISSGEKWGVGSFHETEQLANEWLQKQIGKPHRMPERSIENEDGSITEKQ